MFSSALCCFGDRCNDLRWIRKVPLRARGHDLVADANLKDPSLAGHQPSIDVELLAQLCSCVDGSLFVAARLAVDDRYIRHRLSFPVAVTCNSMTALCADLTHEVPQRQPDFDRRMGYSAAPNLGSLAPCETTRIAHSL